MASLNILASGGTIFLVDSTEAASDKLARCSRGMRKLCVSLTPALAALALSGCGLTGAHQPETVTRHWIQPPAVADLQPMPTSGAYAASTQWQPAAVQWIDKMDPSRVAVPGMPVTAPDDSQVNFGTPPSSWPIPQSIPPAGSADAALPTTAPRVVNAVAAGPMPSAPQAAAQPVQPVRVARLAPVAAAPLSAQASVAPTEQGATQAPPLPSNIPPPQSAPWVAPRPVTWPAPQPTQPVATQTLVPKPAPLPVVFQSGYLPASRTVMPLSPPALTLPAPVPATAVPVPNWTQGSYQAVMVPAVAAPAPRLSSVQQTAASISSWSQTGYQVAVAQAAALPTRRSVSGVWQLSSVAIVDYSARGTFVAQPLRPALISPTQSSVYPQQFGPVTVDYSALR